MSVATSTNKVVISGNGVTTVFSYNFRIDSAGDVQVIYTDALGVSTTLTSAQYSITGLLSPSGGTVTYPLVGSPIASGTSLTILRELPLTQAVSISNQGPFYPESVELAIDRAVMETQQINEVLGRAITSPVTDATAMTALPAIAQRANKALMFDSSGNPIAGATLPAGTVSSVMQPVINAASLGAGRIAFGLGAMAVEGIGAGLQDDGAANARVNFPIVSKSANYVVASTDHCNHFETIGAISFTLPATATLWDGFGFWADAYSATLALAPNAADSIEGNATGASSYIPAGSKAFVTTDGAGSWFVSRVLTNLSSVSPGGYLSPISTRTVPFDDVTATTISYIPDAHGLIPIYDGSEWIPFPFDTLSCALDATQQVVTQAHDVFVILVSGVPTLAIGPAWRQAGLGSGAGGFTSLTNATPIVCTETGHGLVNGDTVYFTGVRGNSAANGAWVVSGVAGSSFSLTGSVGNGTYTAGTGTFSSRGSGTGTTDLAKIGGLYVNANQITAYNGATPYTVAAGKGTYVGSIFIGPASGQVTCNIHSGQDLTWGIWNAYNKKDINLRLTEPTATWAGGTSVWRMLNSDTLNVIQTFVGLPEEPMTCDLIMRIHICGEIGIGFTSVADPAVTALVNTSATSLYCNLMTRIITIPSLGAMRIFPLEYGISGGDYYGGESGTLFSVKYRG